MDAFVLTNIFSKKESFSEPAKMSLKQTIMFVFSLAISAYASYLSWNCSMGDHMFFRILFALFAWFFGVLYVLYYAIFKSGMCKKF